ncbi:hypothetical protein OC844_007448, partial [Tilletia horrida]
EDGIEDPEKIGIRKVITLLLASWDKVSQVTVANCFRHCNIRGVRQEPRAEDALLGDDAGSDSDSENNAEAVQLSVSGQVIDQEAEGALEASIAQLNYSPRMNVQFLLNNPQETEVAETEEVSIEDIVELLGLDEEDEPEIGMEKVADKIITGLAASMAATTLGQWTDQQGGLDASRRKLVRDALRIVEQAAREQRNKGLKQTTIPEMFEKQKLKDKANAIIIDSDSSSDDEEDDDTDDD